ncbi:MAG: type II secretion system secretin GspD [Halofilum sp. (in: g-proteobacteria)]|nr:type II secretion system secretin GspD [Halofilum sp. (in: g-proteobacteria)]
MRASRHSGLATLVVMWLLVAPGAVRAQSDEAFSLNMENAQLRSLIQTVSERTGRNFVVDPRVNAKVTVISSQPVSDRELYEIFETILAVHGYAAVDSEGITRIVPAVTAKQSAVPVQSRRASGDRIVTRVVTVENVSAPQLVPILRPLLPQEAHLVAYDPTNRLIVTDSAANVERIVEIIRRVDQPIDSEVDMIRLEHASAQEVARVLQSLQGPQEQGGPQVAIDQRTNAVLIRGDEEARLEMRTLIANLDTPLTREGSTRVRYLRYANAEDMVGILETMVGARAPEGDGGGESAESEPTIQADQATNSLIIQAPPTRMQEIEAVIRQLDIRRAQVVVEAIIVELSTERARELGFQFFFDGTNDDRPAGLTSFGGTGSNIVELSVNPESVGRGLTIGMADNATDIEFGALLRVLSSDADTNILSTPSLVTLDNEEAEIVVGQNVPFVTGQFTSDQAGADARSPFQTIERRDVGLTLQVKPQINEGDTIKLEIEQEVSNIAQSVQGASDLITNTRELRTTVLVDDGQTLVLGGLIDDQVRTRTEKVPLLGDIPLLGRLFRYDSTSTDKRNLMIFLHPRILHDRALANSYTGEKYSYMRNAQLERMRDSTRLDSGEMPVLPKLELPEIEVYREGGG